MTGLSKLKRKRHQPWSCSLDPQSRRTQSTSCEGGHAQRPHPSGHFSSSRTENPNASEVNMGFNQLLPELGGFSPNRFQHSAKAMPFRLTAGLNAAVKTFDVRLFTAFWMKMEGWNPVKRNSCLFPVCGPVIRYIRVQSTAKCGILAASWYHVRKLGIYSSA